MKYLLFVSIIFLSSCNQSGLGWYDLMDDFFNPPQQAVPCSTYTPITNPAFIQGYTECEKDFPWQITIGPYKDSIYVTDTIGEVMENKIDSLFTKWRPQYQFDVNTSPDGHIINVMCEGTNVRENLFPDGWKEISTRDEMPGWIQLKCYITVQGAAVRINFTFNQQTFLFAGAATYQEQIDYITRFPSSKRINQRNSPVTQTEQHSIYVKNIHNELCKDFTGIVVDFRFDQWLELDSTKVAYKAAGATVLD